MTTFLIIEAKYAGRRAAWTLTNWEQGIGGLKRQERTAEELLQAASDKGYNTSFAFDQTILMCGSNQQTTFMRRIVDRIAMLAGQEFCVPVADRGKIEIEISAARGEEKKK